MTTPQVVLSAGQIQERITELGRLIATDYNGRKLVLLGVLNGSFIFLADLCRAVDLQLEIDFIRVASYGSGTNTSGSIRLTKTPEIDLKDKDVLIVEDIVDTGLTLAWLVDHFKSTPASSVKVCTLVDKKERRKANVTVDYAGFTINQGFLIGYGLDHAEIHRNLPAIYTLV